ncbi:M48 family metallopeptidase [Paenibacillus whitsoniae]|uniref:M48 family peptidase n=1 Tax=Paenibacillus whitsoniae TaxID=2496558 RepID=A0A3S0AEN5_9BACL|nr:M48 family metallopeptidase [Paenibacillus whitsoniae]RTE11165.1 M48 family peptidase [Paenibacillus whitsoniae]
MKQFYIGCVAAFISYCLIAAMIFLRGDLFHIPASLVGTAADPHTFMTAAQIHKAESLSRIHSLSFFISVPLQMGITVALFGMAVRFRNLAERVTRSGILQLGLFLLLFNLLTDVLFLPIDYLLFRIDHTYGISTETIGMFWSDHAKSFLISLLGTLVMVGIYRAVAKRSPQRWWLWLWGISIPLIVFVTFIQPVVLDPLYNKFEPLHNEQLKRQILDLAAQAHIPADQVYQVNMSERTNAINAYVSGIGGNARIVLWDTTLQKLTPEEILTVMAHEMGHYAERHIYWGLAYGIALSFVGFWLAFHAFRWMLQRFGASIGLRGERDLAALPMLLLLMMLMSFISAPLQNAFSRVIEHRADVYAMNMTGDGTAAIHAFQQIAKENLSPVTQPKLVQWFRGSHPTILERILYFENFAK